MLIQESVLLSPFLYVNNQMSDILSNKVKRQPNFEVLRVLAMLFVVIAHFNGWGTTHHNVGPIQVSFANGGINSFCYLLFDPWAAMGVICFVLISSYFICESNMLRFDKMFKIWSQTMFYSVIMALVSSFFINIPIKDILLSFAPIGSDQYWFVTKYMALILLAPLMSVIVNSLSQKGLATAIGVLAFLTVTITCGIPYGNTFFSDSPLSVASFIMLFFIASYIKKYELPSFVENYCGWIFICCILFQSLIGIAVNIMRIEDGTIYGGFSVGYNALSIVPGTALFLWFRKQKFKAGSWCNLLCKIAPYTFAVYLIHDNRYFRQILWNRIIDPATYWNSPLWILIAALVPVVILLLCCLVDYFRGLLFSVLQVGKLGKHIATKNIVVR